MSESPDELVRSQAHLTLAAADIVLDAAVRRAEELGVASVIVVIDAGGGVTSLARLDGAPPIAIRHALGKASSATGLKRSTDDFLGKRLTTDDVLWRAIAGRADAFVVHGGFPLTVGGKLVGAIGVASGAHEHDSEVARAGAEALERHVAATTAQST
ncbi:MAG: heme-binding protein [Actinobacteria bacterium]|nr:heme-binding protein [Actinomycetota bacterium]